MIPASAVMVDFDDINTWHWAIIGIMAGVVVGLGITMAPPRADPVMRQPISLDQFITSVQQSLGGSTSIRNMTIYPIENGQQLVTGQVRKDGFQPFALYIDVPFNALGTHAISVQQYLQAAAKINPQITYRYAWWESDQAILLLSALGGLIVIGGVWPPVARFLRGARHGQLQPSKDNYNLNRFHHDQPTGAAEPVTDATMDSASQHAQALEKQLEGEIVSQPSAPLTPGEPIPVKSLPSTALEPLAAPESKEDKKYQGEFYPVEKPHRSDDGFSLVELLVVIGIIGVLLSLLLPALQRARAVSNVTVCANNLRQLSFGLQMYLNNNHDITFWRGENINSDGMDWYAYGGREAGNLNHDYNDYFNRGARPLNRYVANELSIFRCPCDNAAPWTYDRDYTPWPAPNQFEWVGNSYIFNANGYPLRPLPRHDQGLDGIPFASITNTSQTIVFYETCLYYGYDWHFAHKGNTAFADGHVSFIPLPPQFSQEKWNP